MKQVTVNLVGFSTLIFHDEKNSNNITFFLIEHDIKLRLSTLIEYDKTILLLQY